jgi:hypothetical protein
MSGEQFLQRSNPLRDTVRTFDINVVNRQGKVSERDKRHLRAIRSCSRRGYFQ